jgi:hypothetical protein
MADAAGTWAATTLSTAASLVKIEKEISQLSSVGTLTYSVNAGNVASAITPTAIDVSDGKGSLEIIGVAASACKLINFNITLTGSDDGTTYTAFGTGLTIYAVTTAVDVVSGAILFKYVIPSNFKDYIKPVITTGTSTGTISIYANSVWDDKITLAKSIIGTDLRLLLINNNLLGYIDDDTDEILDDIYNPTTLGMASDFKALELIYSDLARGEEANSLYMQKSRAYKKRYDEYFPKLVQNLVIDLYQDGSDLIYYGNLHFIPQAGR